jgi:hypothetical protein
VSTLFSANIGDASILTIRARVTSTIEELVQQQRENFWMHLKMNWAAEDPAAQFFIRID